MANIKYVYRIMYECRPKPCDEGISFPWLYIRYRRRGRVGVGPNDPELADEYAPDRGEHKYYLIEGDGEHGWRELAPIVVDDLAFRMYPDMYSEDDLDDTSFSERARILRTIVAKYFSYNFNDYVKAVARDRILNAYANYDENRGTNIYSAKWYTNGPVVEDVCMNMSEQAVSHAREGYADFEDTLIDDGVFSQLDMRILDQQKYYIKHEKKERLIPAKPQRKKKKTEKKKRKGGPGRGHSAKVKFRGKAPANNKQE